MKTVGLLLVIFAVGCGGRLEPVESTGSESSVAEDAGQGCRMSTCDTVCGNSGPDRPYAWCERQGDNCAQFDDAVCGVGYCCPLPQ